MVLKQELQLLLGECIKDAYVVSDNDFYVDWFDSGIVDLSCVEGDTLHFAFKYTGSGESEYDGTL